MRISRIILFFLLVSLPVQPVNAQDHALVLPADKNATPETRQLLAGISKLMKSGIMFGHQDDLSYGIGWIAPQKNSDIYSILGDYPAVFGWDLGSIETGSPVNLDSVPFDRMKQFALKVHEMGGINSYSWHFHNPLTLGNTWDVAAQGVVASILPGGSRNELYCTWLDQVAGFFKSLKTENGTLVPVMFRPFHEHTGDWFWWGRSHCSAAEFRQLWQFTFTYLTQTCQVHNLIFVFSSGDNFTSLEDFLERYPGNDYADMLGFDIYQGNNDSNKHFEKALAGKLRILEKAGKMTCKPVALTETGYERIPYDKWWTEVLWPVISKYDLSYVLVWRNAANRPNHFYAPYPGQRSETDFKAMYQLKRSLFLNDIKGKIY